MADNLLPGRYAVGAASVDAGGTIVTPTGATWTDNVWGDDLFFLPSQPLVPPQRIESVNEDGEIVLAYPWPGAGATEEPYEVRFVGMIERSTAQSRKVLEQLGDVKAWYDIIVVDDASRLALETASNPLRAGYRVLVKDDGVIWAKESSAYGDWIGPVEFKGDTGNKGWSPVFGVVADGARRVLQLAAWVGGEGVAPAGVGKYVGGGGLVDDIAQAIDVRGEGFSAKGAYSGATAYAKGDVVRDAGSSWIALQATTGNAPPTLPTTSNAYWELLAQKGADGAGTGDVVGPAGATAGRLVVFSGATGKVVAEASALSSPQKAQAQTDIGISAFAQTLLDDGDAATARTTLGAVGLTGTETVAGAKTFSGAATFSALITANGGGIKFPATQVTSADANTLDDYEEGTYTPTYTNISVGNAVVESHYTKIGRQVTVQWSWTIGSTSALNSSATTIGLPFAGISMQTVGQALASDIGTAFRTGVSFSAGVSVTFTQDNSSGNWNSTGPFTWVTGDRMSFTHTYFTAS